MRIVVILALLVPVCAQAQQFTEKQLIKLNKNIVSADVESADLDNDGLIDVILFTRLLDNSHQIRFLQGDTTNGFTPLANSTVLTISEYSSYSITDYDKDNDLDIVLFGNTTRLMRNEGDFSFGIETIELPAFALSKWLDLDNNGSLEIIGSYEDEGEWITGVFALNGNTWEFKGDNLAFKLSALEVVDANKDGYHDVFVSGSFGADSIFTGFLLNQKDYSFEPFRGNAWKGSAASGDLNGDGLFDVFFVGTDASGVEVQKFFLSKNESYVVRDSALSISQGELFVADFNADGISDISQLNKKFGADTVHTFLFGSGATESETIYFLRARHYVDFEHDGNLDIIQITKPDSLHITFYQNQSAQNLGPSKPAYALANKIFDRYFFFWSAATDDHTAPQSITYNLMVEAEQTLQTAEFDILNERQLRSVHGNNLTQNFKLFKQLPLAPQNFAVQAVDNSLHALAGGVCFGSVTDCPLLESNASTIEVCPNEIVTLTSPTGSLWFSFSGGFLGEFNEYQVQATKTDTLIYYDQTKTDCSALQAFIIKVRDVAGVERLTRYACEGGTLEFEIEEEWISAEWSSDLLGYLGSSRSITYTVTDADTVSVLLQGQGCSVLRKTGIVLSKRVVTTEADHYAIAKGSSVELSASGADRYEWSPVDYLSNPLIANPVASPEENMIYTVTGYDSINCSATATVRITVEEAGFIPNLFTPNGDGKNDMLRIYGLKEVAAFTFTIHNREGKVVYESKNPFEVMLGGWDGTKDGTRQPAGVYFWKVVGRHPSGEVVRLNGKTEGSIILVR